MGGGPGPRHTDRRGPHVDAPRASRVHRPAAGVAEIAFDPKWQSSTPSHLGPGSIGDHFGRPRQGPRMLSRTKVAITMTPFCIPAFCQNALRHSHLRKRAELGCYLARL